MFGFFFALFRGWDTVTVIRNLMYVLTIMLCGCGSGGSNKPSFSVQNLALSTAEDTPLVFTLNFRTTNTGLVSMVVLASPANGSLQGSYPAFTYQPRPDYNGLDAFRAKLLGNGSASGEFTVSIAVTPVDDPPRLTRTPTSHITAGSQYSFSAQALDVDSLQLTYRASNLPPWLTLFPESSFVRIQGTPTNSDLRTWSDIRLTVSDGTTETAMPVFSITVVGNPVRQLADIPSTQRNLTGCAVSDGGLFSFGGFFPAYQQYDADVWRMDLGTGLWEKVARMPEQIVDVEARTVGNRIVLLGGFVSTHPSLLDTDPSLSVWKFDPVTRAWERGASLPVTKNRFGVAVFGSDVFVIGGLSSAPGRFGILSDVGIYDDLSDSWRNGPVLPQAIYDGVAAATGTQVIAIGGRTDSDSSGTNGVGDVFRLEPATGVWNSSLSVSPQAFQSGVFRGVGVGEEVLVFEVTPHDNIRGSGVPPRSVFRHDAITDSIERLAPQIFGGKRTYCVTSGAGKAYILGGSQGLPVAPLGDSSPTVWEYDPTFD